MRTLRLLALVAVGACIAAAQPPPPPPPPPPGFMTMKGLPLSCFAKSNFEQDGLEFFICNGGGGIAGVRRKSDPKHIVFVREQEIAQNLNMQVAKGECGVGKFSISGDPSGFTFNCNGSEMPHREGFQVASKAEWAAWSKYLNR